MHRVNRVIGQRGTREAEPSLTSRPTRHLRIGMRFKSCARELVLGRREEETGRANVRRTL